MKKFHDTGKIKLYQKNNLNSQINERENDFMHISQIREFEDYGNLDNYCTKINKYYLPINVLAHIVKHFPGDSNPQKLNLLEDLLDFENKKYSYMIYKTTDSRFRLLNSKVELTLNFIQVMRNNELYEICITTEIKIGRKAPEPLNQINSYYRVDAFREERWEKLERSDIKTTYFSSDADKYHMFQLTQDSRIQTEKPLEVYEKENNYFASELLKATGNKSVDLSKNFNNKKTLEIPEFSEFEMVNFENEEIIGIPKFSEFEEKLYPSNSKFNNNNMKIPSAEILDFFKERDGKITLKELLALYETDSLPLVSNKNYTIKKIINSNQIEKFSPTYIVMNIIFNENLNSFDCTNMVADKEDLKTMMNDIKSKITLLNQTFNQKIFSVTDTLVKLEINFL